VDRGSQLDEEEKEDEKRKEKEEDENEGEVTNIKSNNPHLASRKIIYIYIIIYIY
jgi:hypothetical protein